MRKTIEVYEQDYEALLMDAGGTACIADVIHIRLEEAKRNVEALADLKGTQFRISNAQRCPFHNAVLSNGRYVLYCPVCNYQRPCEDPPIVLSPNLAKG